MAGYWNNPQATEEAMTADGYFKTGDIAHLDELGYFHIVDRKKDMILVSGFNVYPNEIEAQLSKMPGILECACVGVADEKTEEAVKSPITSLATRLSAKLVLNWYWPYCATVRSMGIKHKPVLAGVGGGAWAFVLSLSDLLISAILI
jgi:long-chain acyl-CoA synthetase